MKKRFLSLTALIIIAALMLCSCNAGVITGAPPTHSEASSFSSPEEAATAKIQAEKTTNKIEDATTKTKETESKQNTATARESTTAQSTKKKENKTEKPSENKSTTKKETTNPDTPSATGGPQTEKKPDNLCTLTIECTDILKNIEYLKEGHEQYVPKSGYILEKTEFTFTEGETVYDLMMRAAETYSIKVTAEHTSYGIYISGINNLDEFDVGKAQGWTSGWVYYVNGEFAKYSSSKYVIESGDSIVFSYSCKYD